MSNDRIDNAERRLVELAAVAAVIDPPPPEVVEDAVASFAWRSIDAELADLVFDSALHQEPLVGIRSNQTSRQMTFEAPNLAIELEYDDRAECRLVGQLVPPGEAEIEICSGDRSTTVHADERGRFWAREFSGHVLSLRIRRPAATIEWVATPWVSLVSPSAS